MKKIGFVGAYDKTDLILSIAGVLSKAERKVLIVDATTTQKSKYVVPVINPTKSYVTEFEGIDIAVGFQTLENIKQYLALDDGEQLEYDFILVDTDTYEGIMDFNLQDSEKIYFVTSFDAYSLKRGLEVLNQLEVPLKMTKLFFSKEMLKQEEDYFEYLALGIRVVWSEDKIYFLLENGDQAALIENQRVAKIKFKNLSNEYKENISYIVSKIDKDLDEKKVKLIIKNL